MRFAPLFAAAWACSSLVCALDAATPEAARPQVRLAGGALAGDYADSNTAVFKGVAFAQAPLGPLRWHEPVPPQAWSGVKQATAYAPACAQMGARGASGSEDCLYLNIWTPPWPVRTPHAVMLWLYGGANAVGSAATATFDGASLARHGVVVVTANYRVGVLGFLAHPALSAESAHHSSGNYALLDQIMALRWIRDNIAHFGGDPRHVTVFGQSSGSYDLLLLMTSPLARGLFVNAIAQSGQLLSYGGSMPKARAEAIGRQIGAQLKAPTDASALRYLRALPAAQVMASAAKWLPTDLDSDTGLLTNIDGWVLREPPARVFAQGREMGVPLILGNNAREITPNLSGDELRQQIRRKYGALAADALQAYGLAGGGDGPVDALLGGAGAQWMTDTVQRCAAILEVAWHAGAQHPVWQYQFERSIPGREAAGSTHGAEVAFVFGTLGSGAASPAYTAADHQASEQLQQYWTRFAKTGNPNDGVLPHWPAGGDGRYLAFTADGVLAREQLQPGPCRIYRQWMLQQLRP